LNKEHPDHPDAQRKAALELALAERELRKATQRLNNGNECVANGIPLYPHLSSDTVV
jgi:hypothetical protein